jgi:adenosylhomocysteine nucleosidase
MSSYRMVRTKMSALATTRRYFLRAAGCLGATLVAPLALAVERGWSGLVVVTGLDAEAEIARRAFPEAKIFCGQSERDALATLVPNGCAAIASFGLCGGLAPHFKVGDLITAYEVTNGEQSISSDYEWMSRIQQCTSASPIFVYSSGTYREADTPEQRKLLLDRTRARASVIDDESLAVARLALERGLKMVVLRVVSDDYQDTIPSIARVAVKRDGSLDTRAALDWLSQNPTELNTVMGLAAKFKRSLAVLEAAAIKVGPTFQL